MGRQTTADELEDFIDQLSGPMGSALRAAGVLIEQQMRERGLAWSDLSDQQVAHLFMSAFTQTAPAAYPHLPRADVEQAVAAMSAAIAMEMAATADGGDSVN